MIGFRGLPHTYGGGEEFITHLAPRLVERGVEVIVYCRKAHFEDRNPIYRGVQRVFLPAPESKAGGQFVHSTLGVLDALCRKPDVVYVHTLPSGPHTIVPWLARQRVVVNVNGMDWARGKWGPVGRAYFRASVQIVLRTATVIVNDSEAMRDFYRKQWGRDSAFIAYGAEIVQSEHPQALGQFGLVPQGYFLIASRLVPENNADLIVEAHRRSRATRPLVIAGGANYESDWVRRLQANAGPNVRFLGHVGDSAVVRELHCNCYAYLHGHSLGGTNPALLKALGAGNCIAALDTPFNREVLRDGAGSEYGVLFPRDVDALASTIARLDADTALAVDLRARAPRRIREAYTWDRIADQYAELFRSVAEGRRSAG
jgi:glycosyltransferase involved in cell wall biosynthesis